MNQLTGRLDTHQLLSSELHWGAAIAQEVIKAFPNQECYTCAAGISPSGTVHFGNFRDVITSYAVARGLRDLGVKARVLFSWDDYDSFRKVPSNVPASFDAHLGKPLTEVPSPAEEGESYARFFERPFEHSLASLGIEVEWRYQSELYRSGRYLQGIVTAMRKREQIADILLGNMSEKAMLLKGIDAAKFRSEYYPLTVYSQFSGTDNTCILDYDGGTVITYECLDTTQRATIDFAMTPIVKLPWKIDWPMRWCHEQVHFEPGGRDHASPGGSFDSSGTISRVVFDRRPPAFVGYDFIGLKGLPGKMSGSRGGALTVAELLEVYEPAVLVWLYLRRPVHQQFTIAFDTEVYRVYDEFDREREATATGTLSPAAKTAIDWATAHGECSPGGLSFRQIVALGQIVQWDLRKLSEVAAAASSAMSPQALRSRAARARLWLEKYRPDEQLQLRVTPDRATFDSLSEEIRAQLDSLVSFLQNTPDATVSAIEETMYRIPKNPDAPQPENSRRQRNFFAAIYQLLLGRDTGPRLSTFLWASDRRSVLALLSPS